MKTFSLFFVLWVTLGLSQGLPGQATYEQARGALTRGEKAKDAEGRASALALVTTCSEPKIVRDILNAILRADKEIEKLDSRIEKTGAEVQDIWRSVDKQADAGRSVSVGSVEGAIKKFEAVQQQLNKEIGERDERLAWRRGLLISGGEVLGALPSDAASETVAELLKEINRSRDLDNQVSIISLLSRAKSESSRLGLLEMFATAADGALRTAMVDALKSNPDKRNLPLLRKALSDEVWTVRVAAATVLERTLDPEVIGILIEALPGARGRTLEEYLRVLESHVGRTFHDNATLWEEWWVAQKSDIETVWTGIQSSEVPTQIASVTRAKDLGIALFARALLEAEGIRTNGEAGQPAEGAVADDADALALRSLKQEAIANILSSRPERIRNALTNQLIISPFMNAKDLALRERIIQWGGAVNALPMRSLVTVLASDRPIEDASTGSAYGEADRERLRLVAIKALGNHDHEDAVKALTGFLTGASASPAARLASAEALKKTRRTDAVAGLIQGLRNRDTSVKESCVAALKELTGQTHPVNYEPWMAWWRTVEKDFTPRGAVARNEEKETQRPEGASTTFYGIESRSEHVVFILDRSGSMTTPDQSGGTKISAAREELIRAITALKDGSTFNIIFYSSGFEEWQKKMTVVDAASRKKAIDWVKNIEAVGSTNIFDPIERAFELAGRGTHDKAYGLLLDTIYFMSDGLANRGRIIAAPDILNEIGRMNSLKKVKIHTIGIGPDHDVGLMRGIANLTGGTYIAR
jgi:HEAT repeat protein